MAEMRSGFQKLVENGCTPRRKRGPGSIRGRLKEGKLSVLFIFFNLKFPPTTIRQRRSPSSPCLDPPFITPHLTMHFSRLSEVARWT
ncbi:unnamed protein product [Onchocerca flexuosa]|uniref:Uncharacterized protein n=1 Tax=Onchocerca flexuosa TaxID=387005 RepID=A0A183H1I5_9BILA|nr:unnamed protein product [Onchocerca flexuosa]